MSQTQIEYLPKSLCDQSEDGSSRGIPKIKAQFIQKMFEAAENTIIATVIDVVQKSHEQNVKYEAIYLLGTVLVMTTDTNLFQVFPYLNRGIVLGHMIIKERLFHSLNDGIFSQAQTLPTRVISAALQFTGSLLEAVEYESDFFEHVII
jgi:hypothetical protein